METWLELLRGPLFRFALVIAVLGLGRALFLSVWGAAEAYYKANDKNIPWGKIAWNAAGWMVPVKRLFTTNHTLHGFLTFAMHLGAILVPLFLLDHILLWKAGLGISWPALPKTVADVLTLVTAATAGLVVISRVASRTSRVLSKFQDYFLPLLVMVLFLTGFMASRPWNPMSWETSMVIHVAAGDTLLILAPFTKLAHMVVWPVTRLTGEIGWKFPSRAGEKVGLTLDGEEVRPI